MVLPFYVIRRFFFKFSMFAILSSFFSFSNWTQSNRYVSEAMREREAAVQLTIIQSRLWTTPPPFFSPYPTTCRTYYQRLSWSGEHKAQREREIECSKFSTLLMTVARTLLMVGKKSYSISVFANLDLIVSWSYKCINGESMKTRKLRTQEM